MARAKKQACAAPACHDGRRNGSGVPLEIQPAVGARESQVVETDSSSAPLPNMGSIPPGPRLPMAASLPRIVWRTDAFNLVINDKADKTAPAGLSRNT